MTFKPLYLIYAFDNFFGITTAYFKIIRLTSLISLYSLSKISQGASSAMRSEPGEEINLFFASLWLSGRRDKSLLNLRSVLPRSINETVPLSTGLFFFFTVLSFLFS